MTQEAILVGAGQRGRHVYGAFAERHPERLKFVAVADPDDHRSSAFGDLHDIPRDRRFADWEDALAIDAPLVVIASPDRHHDSPAIAALRDGRHVLLEKPIAHSVEATRDVVEAAVASAASLHVAHVLRYTPFFNALHRTVASGRLGDLVSVEHRENVVSWHMAHSFVRGNWAREGAASPMIVQKCCHDFDILAWNLDSPVARLHSFGSLQHFRPEHAPQGSTERCLGCSVAPTCPFDATRIYLDERRTGWPIHVITDDLSPEGRRRALETGPYGRCVYLAGSDVVDHQTVSMELESGATATLIMHGHSHEEARTMRYDGTHGTVRATFGAKKEITFTDHRGGDPESIPIDEAIGGHGGGDTGLIGSVLESIASDRPPTTGAVDAWESHLLAFAAEESRLEGTVVDVAARRAI